MGISKRPVLGGRGRRWLVVGALTVSLTTAVSMTSTACGTSHDLKAGDIVCVTQTFRASGMLLLADSYRVLRTREYYGNHEVQLRTIAGPSPWITQERLERFGHTVSSARDCKREIWAPNQPA